MPQPELLNNTLWDERDLTNNSSERMIFSETCELTDHILKLTEGIITNLRFYPENIKRNLNLLNGLNKGEAVMIELATRGVGKQEAHETELHMKDVLMSKVEVTEYISAREIEEIMDPEKYIGTAVEQVEAVVERIRNKL